MKKSYPIKISVRFKKDLPAKGFKGGAICTVNRGKKMYVNIGSEKLSNWVTL